MKRLLGLTAVVSALLTMLAMWGLGWAELPATVKLENARVKLSKVNTTPVK